MEQKEDGTMELREDGIVVLTARRHGATVIPLAGAVAQSQVAGRGYWTMWGDEELGRLGSGGGAGWRRYAHLAGKRGSCALARNTATTSSPFSALEVVPLDDSVYNSTDILSYTLSTIARHNFGHDGISDPGDQFNR